MRGGEEVEIFEWKNKEKNEWQVQKEKKAFTFRECEGIKIYELREMPEKKNNWLVGKGNGGDRDF